MKHKIEITETLQRVIEVEASTMEDAERAALALHRSGEVVLSADDFVSVSVYRNGSSFLRGLVSASCAPPAFGRPAPRVAPQCPAPIRCVPPRQNGSEAKSRGPSFVQAQSLK